MDVNGTLLNNGLYTNLNPFSPSFVLARLFLPVGSSYPSSLFLSSFLFFFVFEAALFSPSPQVWSYYSWAAFPNEAGEPLLHT